jgi:tRNA(Phe) wybutosine-synthesizing methylase Tyw3
MDSIDSLVRDVIRDETSQYITEDDISHLVTDDYVAEIADDLSDKLTELQAVVDSLRDKLEKQNQAVDILYTQMSQVAQVKPSIVERLLAWIWGKV